MEVRLGEFVGFRERCWAKGRISNGGERGKKWNKIMSGNNFLRE
jgi:hypothetical protein